MVALRPTSVAEPLQGPGCCFQLFCCSRANRALSFLRLNRTRSCAAFTWLPAAPWVLQRKQCHTICTAQLYSLCFCLSISWSFITLFDICCRGNAPKGLHAGFFKYIYVCVCVWCNMKYTKCSAKFSAHSQVVNTLLMSVFERMIVWPCHNEVKCRDRSTLSCVAWEFTTPSWCIFNIILALITHPVFLLLPSLTPLSPLVP